MVLVGGVGGSFLPHVMEQGGFLEDTGPASNPAGVDVHLQCEFWPYPSGSVCCVWKGCCEGGLRRLQVKAGELSDGSVSNTVVDVVGIQI